MRTYTIHPGSSRSAPVAIARAGLFLMAAFLVLPRPSVAQDTASESAPDSTVAQVLVDPEDDQQVVLRGSILEQLSTEKYMFSDDTGQIRVDIERDDFPDMEFTPNMQIEISGEVETAFMRQPEIDVKTLTVLQETP